ncbi:MAG: hemerythrin domain-containing protein [Betaproteobacteria bacterium]
MVTRKSSSKSAAGNKSSATTSSAPMNDREDNDAIDLLLEDHRRVDAMFEEYESAKESDDEGEKLERVEAICMELTIHAAIEEEIFYPAAREALGEEGADVLDEATVEHTSIKDLVAQLAEAQPGDEMYDAKVKVLGEYVKHHVDEEEGQLFPQLRDAEFDAGNLAEEMIDRKEQLRDELESHAAA